MIYYRQPGFFRAGNFNHRRLSKFCHSDYGPPGHPKKHKSVTVPASSFLNSGNFKLIA